MRRALPVRRWFRSIPVAVLVAFTLMACGGAPSGGPGGLAPEPPADVPTDAPADTPTDTAPDVPSSGVLGIAVVPYVVTLRVGEHVALVANIEAADDVDVSVVWSSDTVGVASVDESGAVHAHGLGSAIVTATSVADPDVAATASVTVVEVSGLAPASVRFVSGGVGVAIVGTDVVEAPRVEVVDADGRPVVGHPVRFELVAGDGAIEPTNPVITDVEGMAELSGWRLGTVARVQRLRASIDGADPPVTAELALDVLPGPPSPLTSSIAADPTLLPADGTSTTTLSVTLRDAYDNPVVAHDATVTFDTPTAGAIGAATTMPDGSVVATFTAPAVAATVGVTARIDGVAIAATVTIDVVETPTVTAVSIDGGDLTLSLGDVVALSAAVTATGGASEAVDWSSDDDAVVTVSADGILTAVGLGTTDVVAVSVAEPSVQGRISVTVVDALLPDPVPWTYGIVTTGSFLVSGSSVIATHVWVGGEVYVGGASSIAADVDVWAGGSCRVGMAACMEGMEPPSLAPLDWAALSSAVVERYLGGGATDVCDVQHTGSISLADARDTVICLEPGASLALHGDMTGVIVLGDASTSVVTHGNSVPSANRGGLGIAIVAGAVELRGRDSRLTGVTTVVAAENVTVEASLGAASGHVEVAIVALGDVAVTQSPVQSRAIIRAGGAVAVRGGGGVGTFAGSIIANLGDIEVNTGLVFERSTFTHFLSEWR